MTYNTFTISDRTVQCVVVYDVLSLDVILGDTWERFWEENWGTIRGQNPSEVVNETIQNTFK